jgi:hypothetical protein
VKPAALRVSIFVHVHVDVKPARRGERKQAVQQQRLVKAAGSGVIISQAAAVAARNRRAEHATGSGHRIR